MNLNYCISPPKSILFNQPMAFNITTTGLRLLRCYSQHLRPVLAQFSGLRKVRVSALRFLYSSVPREKLPVVKAKRREAEDGVFDDGGGDNGSVVLAAGDKIGGGSGGSEGRIVVSELHKGATEAYMAYAMSVLLGRALPDVQDGLKPVHRRIVFAMHELGLSSRKPYKKCVGAVGEVCGKFHPHGDTAVYDSLVRMVQAFLDFRCSVIERRARFKLSHAQDRNHIVEGIIVGLDNLDGVIDIIRKASSHSGAAAQLMKDPPKICSMFPSFSRHFCSNNRTSIGGIVCSMFPSFSRHFCSNSRTSIGGIDNDGEEDDDDESEADESEDAERVHLSGKSDEQKVEEAAEIGYKVIGPLEESDRVFKSYETVFAVVQVGSHQFKVSNGDSIFVEKLKYCDVNDKLILNRVLMLGSTAQTIIGRPVLPDAAVHAVVEEHALDAKVTIFKKKRRKNYRRTKGHRQELTKLRITDIQGIEKPEPILSLKTEKRATKKAEKIARSA